MQMPTPLRQLRSSWRSFLNVQAIIFVTLACSTLSHSVDSRRLSRASLQTNEVDCIDALSLHVSSRIAQFCSDNPGLGSV
ncbi:hypothetical protein V1525DRAFT_400007 [Lipomyces kononenkoae]|uniref:Uncharacterized protein n=1 Tax=Lipomyces kononenkoae TaxID=34357 RepID=A0ACC3T7C0_LIPKO